MLQMGDEYGHSKGGNNNTYCHDSELNWVDWRQVEADPSGFGRFVRQLIHFRCVCVCICVCKRGLWHMCNGSVTLCGVGYVWYTEPRGTRRLSLA